MRFFEYESRRIVAKAGIPVSAHGFATTPEEARELAAGIGAPTVIKSQVLTGGRMKAGGVKFADTPAEAAAHAEAILALEIGGHMPRGVLVDSRVAVKQEYYAGVTWDGTRKRPVLIFSDMGGIDIEEVAETHPDRVGRGHFSTLRPFSDFEAKQVIASVGVTGRALTRLSPILTRLARLFRERVDLGERHVVLAEQPREPHERERLVAAQVGEVEHEVDAVLVHEPADRLLDGRELDVPEVRPDIDHAGPLAEPPDGGRDKGRGRQWVRHVGAHEDDECPGRRGA